MDHGFVLQQLLIFFLSPIRTLHCRRETTVENVSSPLTNSIDLLTCLQSLVLLRALGKNRLSPSKL